MQSTYVCKKWELLVSRPLFVGSVSFLEMKVIKDCLELLQIWAEAKSLDIIKDSIIRLWN